MYNGGVKQRGQQLADWQPALGSLDTDLLQFNTGCSVGRNRTLLFVAECRL